MNSLDENENAFDALKEKLDQSEDYFELASTGKRFANYLIDIIAFYFIIFVLAIALAALGASWILVEGAYSYVLIFGVMITYYTLMEYYIGQTIGKIITKTKVVDEFGNKPTFSKILGRTFSRFIPLEGLTFFGNGIGLHDSLPGTKVVNIERKNIDELV